MSDISLPIIKALIHKSELSLTAEPYQFLLANIDITKGSMPAGPGKTSVGAVNG